MPDELRILDLSSRTFDEFVNFFFARNVVPDQKQFHYFLLDEAGQKYDEAVPSSPETLVEYMTKLFSQFGQIVPRFSPAQVNQGVWALLGGGSALDELLWDSAVPLRKRLGCIRSMYWVFSDFVATSKVDVMENCFNMWWDVVAHSFWFQSKLYEAGIQMGDVLKLDAESRLVLDVMFETLKRVLELSDSRAQSYALHGLGHLYHPDVQKTVQEFINSNKSHFTSEGLRWLEECRDGTVM